MSAILTAQAGAPAAGAGPGYWPFVVLLISVALIVVLITVLRVHAFLALILAAIAAGLLAPIGSLPGEPAKGHFVQAVELTTAEFGSTAGKIGVVIGLAAVIGLCLMESGGADKVVRRFLAVFGEKRSGIAILASSYVLSIPIFFDTFFMLVLPIARALALRTGSNYVMYVMGICAAGRHHPRARGPPSRAPGHGRGDEAGRGPDHRGRASLIGLVPLVGLLVLHQVDRTGGLVDRGSRQHPIPPPSIGRRASCRPSWPRSCR